jgi:predicted lipoprotein with Yx(FWY)xxD motif
VGTCIDLWKPLVANSRLRATLVSGGRFGVVRRPDGTTQLTAGTRRLYAFVEDSPGQVNGNGFQDRFRGRHFTWHAVRSSGAVALPGAQATAKTPVQSTNRSYGSPY